MTRKMGKKSPPRAGHGESVRRASKALPNATGHPDTGQPGGGQGRVDITGTMPEGIRVDPDLTEGHPGYQEGGTSEIIPASARGGEADSAKDSSG